MSFILSKIIWVLMAPDDALVLLFLIAGFLAVAQRKSWQDFGRRMAFTLSLILFLIAILPMGEWALTPLESHNPAVLPQHVDGIIVLGGDENPYASEKRNQPTAAYSLGRYMRAADLARQYPEAQLVFSGGSNILRPHSTLKDAEVAKQAMAEMGAATGKMILETQSRNTYENAVKTADIIHPTAQQNWLLVTSAWHMPRALATFRKAGWNVYPQPANYMTSGEYDMSLHLNLLDHLQKLTYAVHEYIGLVAYKLMGRTDKIWP